MTSNELLANAIADCLKENGYGVIISAGIIFIYQSPLYDMYTLLAYIQLDVDFVNVMATRYERMYYDYSDPMLIDKIITLLEQVWPLMCEQKDAQSRAY